MELKPGKIIDGYTLEEKLGEGGFGQVWKVRSRTNAVKAMKFPKKNELLKEFFREAEANKRLEHKNILKIEQLQIGNQPYLLMEFLDGQNLRNIRGLTRGQAIDIILQSAQAVLYAHEQGVIHSDLKPENILISENLEVKVCDFGLAKILADDAQSRIKLSNYSSANDFQGTIQYASPEQIEGKQPTVQSDVFSLTKILYELVTGKHLGIGEHPYDGLKKAGVKKNLAFFIKKGVEYDPEKRFSTMEEFIDELERIRNIAEYREEDGLTPRGASVLKHVRDSHEKRISNVEVVQRQAYSKPDEEVPYKESPAELATGIVIFAMLCASFLIFVAITESKDSDSKKTGQETNFTQQRPFREYKIGNDRFLRYFADGIAYELEKEAKEAIDSNPVIDKYFSGDEIEKAYKLFAGKDYEITAKEMKRFEKLLMKWFAKTRSNKEKLTFQNFKSWYEKTGPVSYLPKRSSDWLTDRKTLQNRNYSKQVRPGSVPLKIYSPRQRI
ncbi:hypothetical protein DRJ25_01615 [Candidatus Woesearchaeota archaeon]|nr:MAG: hypothetical protein DRJ25_01615 [Candidatus Woesearchaeota archaeon]